MQRRNFLLSVSAVSCALPAIAKAGSLRIVVPYPPGGITDAFARALSERLAQTRGTTVIVENRAGANGLLGIQNVMSSQANGETALLVNQNFVTLPLTLPTAKYRPAENFRSIAGTPAQGLSPDLLALRET